MANGETSTYFDYPDFITKEQYIRNLLTAPSGQKAQIINFNINYIDDRLAKTITKVYSHLLFDYCKDNRNVSDSALRDCVREIQMRRTLPDATKTQ